MFCIMFSAEVHPMWMKKLLNNWKKNAILDYFITARAGAPISIYSTKKGQYVHFDNTTDASQYIRDNRDDEQSTEYDYTARHQQAMLTIPIDGMTPETIKRYRDIITTISLACQKKGWYLIPSYSSDSSWAFTFPNNETVYGLSQIMKL